MEDNLCYSNLENNNFYKCLASDDEGEKCIECIDGYFLGSEDKKCSKIFGCKKSKDENSCLECEDKYCFDISKNICIPNDYVYDINEKFYFKCNKTNDKGNECILCENDDLILENGLCIDKKNCENEEKGVCIKCKEKNDDDYFYCLNDIFGCVETYRYNCSRCDDMNDIFGCTKCYDGFEMNEKGFCVEIENENEEEEKS